jgi:hypothetical protein
MRTRMAWAGFGMLALTVFAGAPNAGAQEKPPQASPIDLLDLTAIRSGVHQGTEAKIWPGDKRYRDVPPLKPGATQTVADVAGPAVITLLHFAKPAGFNEKMARGVVLQVYFDDAREPAVMCPVADFFGDGCGGRCQDFSTRLIEVVPAAWNAYFPMPFRSRARIVLRNDTPDQTFFSYYVVEWQRLPEWKPDLGYFHATWRRKGFWLTDDTREEFFRVAGKGHVLGRQFSIATDAPQYANYNFVMEGNNELDIDGRPRAMEYLGSEDSFTFSWGFQRRFAGLHAGMPYLDVDATRSPEQNAKSAGRSRLSLYRFHDHMPIRFDKELRWWIDWKNETFGRQRGWVDYATVFYWYQDSPSGFVHEPLPPVAVRCLDVLPKPDTSPDWRRTFDAVPLDAQLDNAFDAAGDLRRVRILNALERTHPFWIDKPLPRGGHPGQPNPGKQGILAVHPAGVDEPCYVLRKVALPAAPAATPSGPQASQQPSLQSQRQRRQQPWLQVVVSGDPYEGPGRSDFLLRAGVYHGGTVRWFPEETINAGTPPDARHWRTLEYPLDAYAGQTIGLVVRVSYGGPGGIFNEEAFFDALRVAIK